MRREATSRRATCLAPATFAARSSRAAVVRLCAGIAALGAAVSLVAPREARADDGDVPVALSLASGGPGAPWKIHVENTGTAPVRVTADARVLSLEITPAPGTSTKKTATVTCALPNDTRPSTDDGPELVIPPQGSWTHAFDPFYYCFGAKERAALTAGAVVKARLGWASRAATNAKAKAAPPFVASASGGGGARKFLESAPVTLPETTSPSTTVTFPRNASAPTPRAPEPKASPSASAAPPSSPPPSASAAPASATSSSTPPSASAAPSNAPSASAVPASPPPASTLSDLEVTMTGASDHARGAEITTSVTVKNASDRKVTLLLRPSMFRFEVTGPEGAVSCGETTLVDSPIRELFSTLAPKGRASVSLLLTSVCPAGTFDRAGVYRVTAMVDTSGASGRPLGMRTWDGIAAAKDVGLVRIRTPRRADLALAPSLD